MNDRRGLATVWTILALLLLVLLVPVQRHFQRVQAELDVKSCRANLKKWGVALEMYSTDNTGRFPTVIGVAMSKYVPIPPQCPAAMADTYSAGYVSVSNPDRFTITCAGDWHAVLPPNERLHHASSDDLSPLER